MSSDLRDLPDVEKGLLTPATEPLRDFRKLAIASIICGLSCCGILSLVYSVKAREVKKGKLRVDTERKAQEYSYKALKCGIIAIVCWMFLLVLVPLLLGLLSYILTFID